MPISAALVPNQDNNGLLIVLLSLITLAISGSVGAFLGGGQKIKAAIRVLAGGGFAMAITALIGNVVGTHL